MFQFQELAQFCLKLEKSEAGCGGKGATTARRDTVTGRRPGRRCYYDLGQSAKALSEFSSALYNCSMSAPILATKLYIPPPRPELVSRPRLIERLNEGMHCKLTLISAPAGFGKTQ